MRLFLKPTTLTGVREHDHPPDYREDPETVKRTGSINNIPVDFVLSPNGGPSWRVSFFFAETWFYIDSNYELYRSVEVFGNKSHYLQFYVE
jgi:hypothetical protein